MNPKVAVLLAFLALGCASTPDDYPSGGAPELSSEDISLLRASCRGGASMEIGPVEVSSTSYPCEILRTYAAIEATEGRGWLMGAVPRFFLKARLVTKGFFSGLFGLVGLG